MSIIMHLSATERAYLERELERNNETTDVLEDQLTLLYQDQSQLHDLMRRHVRGPAPRLMRQLKAVQQKIDDAERRLRLARAVTADTVDKLSHA